MTTIRWRSLVAVGPQSRVFSKRNIQIKLRVCLQVQRCLSALCCEKGKRHLSSKNAWVWNNLFLLVAWFSHSRTILLERASQRLQSTLQPSMYILCENYSSLFQQRNHRFDFNKRILTWNRLCFCPFAWMGHRRSNDFALFLLSWVWLGKSSLTDLSWANLHWCVHTYDMYWLALTTCPYTFLLSLHRNRSSKTCKCLFFWLYC